MAKDERVALVKARVVGGDRPAPRAEKALDEVASAFDKAGAVEPPYDPDVLVSLLEHSNSLRQCVDAYNTNIHAHGHHFEPVIDLKSDDVDVRIANLLFLQRAGDAAVDNPNTQASMPTPDEVANFKREIEEQMRLEKMRLAQFFQNCSLDVSFETLRMMTGLDKEVLGNGYWEVIRDEGGDVAQFNYIAGFTMRLLPMCRTPIPVEEKVREDDVTWGEIEVRKHFRGFVQVLDSSTEAIYFREFGDPRIMSHLTGEVYDTVEQMEEAEPHAAQATEVLHFKVHSPRSAYGVPRWIGQLLAVLGSRQVDEVNHDYFENKTVPPLALLVSGGRVADDSYDAIAEHIDSQIRGKKNYHKILLIEAEGPSAQGTGESGKARVELKPLTVAQHNDALFQKYDERNIDKVGQSFRLPRMLRGDIRDFNRATADAALEFAEMQVFAPERSEFDYVMNRRVLPALGIRFWSFKSNSPRLTDPVEHGKMIAELQKEGVLVPSEARQEAEKVLNRELRNIEEPWTSQPMAMTLAMAGHAPTTPEATATEAPLAAPSGNGGQPGSGATIPESDEASALQNRGHSALQRAALLSDAHYLIGLRNAMAEAEAYTAERDFVEAREAERSEDDVS